ncbi:MAG TPA: archease [Candidatus Thermoplasmatota archaeon]|jgi:SHS2 domain-containing protein|nr:archease [Candidatus Thermoplasmatota archaeon]
MFRFVEDVSVADVAFEARGRDLAELLREAGRAVTATMVKDLASVRARDARVLAVQAPDAERLLHRFLQEVIYLKDAERLLLSEFDARVREEPGQLQADVAARGEPLDASRHEQVVDVKAVTWHRFRVARTAEGWEAFVVLDI